MVGIVGAMRYLNKIKQKFDIVKVAPNTGEVLCHCDSTVCIDKKPALYANAKTGWYFCHRCLRKGKLTVEDFEETLLEPLTKDKPKRITDIDIYKNALQINTEYTPPYFIKGLHYLEDRGFSLKELKEYNVRITGMVNGRKYKNRILFPCFYHGKMVSFIARTFVGDSPKYLISPTIDGNEYIYNYDLAAISKNTLVITEGVVDSIAVSRLENFTGVGLLGKFLSERKLAHIRDLAGKIRANRIYLFYDGDVQRKIVYDTAAKLADLYGYSNTYIVKPPPGRDAGDMNPLELEDLLSNSQNMFYLV